MLETVEVYMLLKRSRVALCIAGSFFASSAAFCAGAIFAGIPSRMAHVMADVPSAVRPVAVPEDVAVGMLIYKVNPEYPKKAKAALVSGIVLLRATISKTGEIADLRAECGPELLREASLDAVRQWKYRPYLLHGEPVEVETTIRVTFNLGGKKKLKYSQDSCPAE
jgi:periplasmic protein TonB